MSKFKPSMTSEEVVYKGRRITVYLHSQPANQWLAEISINGDPRPIDRISAASQDFIYRNALGSAKRMVDAEE